MAKRMKKKQFMKPDDVFQFGPHQYARFGKDIFYQSNWDDGQFVKFRDNMIEKLPEIISEIDSLVAQIAQLVVQYPPLKLLHRAFWELARECMIFEGQEKDVEPDTVSMRMLDYIQSVLVSVSPQDNQKDEVDEEGWRKLKELVDSLFKLVNMSYLISLTCKKQKEDPEFDEFFEDFSVKAQLHWINVRGEMYPCHQVSSLRDTLSSQSELISNHYGLSSDALCDEIEKIWDSLSNGISDSHREIEKSRKQVLKILETEDLSDVFEEISSPEDIGPAILKKYDLEDELHSAVDKFLGYGLFDLEKVCDLPKEFLEDFSWSLGENQDFFAEGDLAGWPLRIWPVFQKPFIKIEGKFYCFDLHQLFDHFYRQLEKKLYAISEEVKQEWIHNRKETSEKLPLDYFQKLMPGCEIFREVYYRWKPEGAQNPNWFETDSLILYQGHLFVIEVKAGAFTYTSPATDIPAYIRSLRGLVEAPAKQGNRFLDYMKSAGTVSIFDDKHKEVSKISLSDFHSVTLCAVTLDPFTEIAAQTQHLRKIGINPGQQPVWTISINDLRVYADLFINPLQFLHFVEVRKKALASDVLHLDDELDHIGLYHSHNYYEGYAEDKKGGQADRQINFLGYRTPINEFFSKKLFDPEASPFPIQEMPLRMREVIDHCAAAPNASKAKFTSFLLDLNGGWREQLFGSIDPALFKSINAQEAKPISIHGDVNITVFAYSIPSALPKHGQAIDHTHATMAMNDEKERFLIELTYAGTGRLVNVQWEKATLFGLSKERLEVLKKGADNLKQSRRQNYLARQGTIGRNDPCFCGSGRKYKKCCGG